MRVTGTALTKPLTGRKDFSDLGADMLFVEAPQSEAEMARVTSEAPGIHMANLVEGGATPILHPDRLHELGYSFAAYPLTLMSAAMKAIQASLAQMARREHPADRLLDFADLRKAVGFDAYYEAESAYSDNRS